LSPPTDNTTASTTASTSLHGNSFGRYSQSHQHSQSTRQYVSTAGIDALPHWYVHPGAPKTSPVHDRVLDFKALRPDATAKKFSSDYWATKLGVRLTKRNSPTTVPEQTYRYRSPLSNYET
jgi:hypothetical protein